jgi:hypothetical protein
MTNGLVDATDLYRAGLVQGVAAWDRYIHGVTLDRGVEIMLGRLTAGAASKVGLPLGAVATLMNAADAATRELAARSYFAERLAKETRSHTARNGWSQGDRAPPSRRAAAKIAVGSSSIGATISSTSVTTIPRFPTA